MDNAEKVVKKEVCECSTDAWTVVENFEKLLNTREIELKKLLMALEKCYHDEECDEQELIQKNKIRCDIREAIRELHYFYNAIENNAEYADKFMTADREQYCAEERSRQFQSFSYIIKDQKIKDC